jgi:hypothetical protein|tara:strand:+ start:218 stop:457 length:240 start_codon:yes stop_codon:yes gene_type:complete
MSEEIKLSEEELEARNDFQMKLQRNLLAIGDIEAAIERLKAQKQTHIGEHMSLTKDIQEFNATLNSKYAPKESVLSVEE